MEINYLGHACFKLRGQGTTVVMDPYPPSVGPTMSKVSADIITVSHHHDDHDAVGRVTGTARRDEPFVIDAPGEYEVNGVSIYGMGSFHDANEGADRGKNAMFVVTMDEVRVAHLGDLGHQLSDKQVEELGSVDVLLCPVGGVYTLDPKGAVSVINAIQPSYVVPMHYKTKTHDQKVFGELSTVDEFLSEMGASEAKREQKLSVSISSIPEEMEVVVLE